MVSPITDRCFCRATRRRCMSPSEPGSAASGTRWRSPRGAVTIRVPVVQAKNTSAVADAPDPSDARTVELKARLRRKSKTEKPYVTDIHNSAASSSCSARAVQRNLLGLEYHFTCRVGLPACNGSSGTPATRHLAGHLGQNSVTTAGTLEGGIDGKRRSANARACRGSL
jgi:hypothetical protein